MLQLIHLHQSVMMQIYVDDPWAAARGKKTDVETKFAMMAALWLCMGFPMAFHKALVGRQVTWTGIVITVEADGVSAEIAAEKIDEMKLLTKDLLSSNVIAKKKLRTYVGKAESMASLLFALRPFVQPLWSALYAEVQAPPNCIWTKMIKPALTWLKCFFNEEGTGPLRRKFYIKAHYNQGIKIVITTDASPWGMGGYITVDGVIIA